tara:strand:+ start:383 stop:1129 length:747 start_codon:yes stop_codon:yes gene_type:complete
MLIELKSSPTDPMNTPSRMLQRFKETLILKPNSRVALQSALITTNAETYAVLTGAWSHDGDPATTITFDATGATAYWKYKTNTEWWRPTTGNSWLVFTAEPVAFGTAANKTAIMNTATNTLTLSDGGLLMTDRVLERKYIKNHTLVPQIDNDVILVNITNFPINSRNASGNTDNHIATIPKLLDLNDTTDEIQFYEPFNPTAHSLDNEADLNMNFIEVELLNSDGTQRVDLIHPTQITLRITHEISAN